MKTLEAIELFGSRRELAEELGISRAAISQWGEDVPELREYQIRLILIERGTNPAPRPQESAA